MRKRLSLIISILVISFFISSQSNAITIGFEPISQDVPLGSQAIVNLFISGLGDYTSPSLGAFDLDILYDPAILSFSSYALGAYLGDIGLGEAMDLSSGEISPELLNISELSLLYANETVDPCYPPGVPPYLDYIQPSSFLLATLTFDTLTLGTSPLEITRSVIGDAYGDLFPLVAIQSGNVNVVPEPATIVLISVGLVSLGVVKQFRIRNRRELKSKF